MLELIKYIPGVSFVSSSIVFVFSAISIFGSLMVIPKSSNEYTD